MVAPGASIKRNIKAVTITNNHATTSNLITVEQFDGTNADIVYKGTLLAGETAIFDECGVWTTYASDPHVPKLPAPPSDIQIFNT
ncbi:MAG: hypothetical protein EB125_10200, partial [Betaproteobacteria bacterium]|nr:hypothetical protein [Betaproteobacteria bacterium]